METTTDTLILAKESENGEQSLLRSLLKGCREFLEKKEIFELSQTLKRIFYHGLVLDSNDAPNIRRVLGVLDFLQEKSVDLQRSSFNKWLLENIQKGKLTNLLSFFFSDTEHINSCYVASSFIRNEGLQNALMTCISAVETNQPDLIAEIDPVLLSITEVKRLGHRRTSSHPVVSQSRKSILANYNVMSRSFEKVKVTKLRPWKSLPNLQPEVAVSRPRSQTVNPHEQKWKLQKKVSFKNEVETENGEEVPYFEYKDSVTANKTVTPKVPVHVVNVEDIKIHTDYRLSPDYQRSPSSSLPRIVSKKPSMFSFLDQTSDASKISSNSVPHMSSSPTDIFFSVVAVGEKVHSTSPIVRSLEESAKKRKSSRQNLAYFLQTINSSSRTKVALDRENAHFHLSEAIIATSQQLKMNKLLEGKYKKIPKIIREGSFSPQRQLHTQPPRINAKFIVGSIDDDSESSLSNEDVSDPTTSSDELCEVVPQMEWNFADDPMSAESIAMMLMTKFKNQPLPNPKSLLWLVNESQAPQQMLPFPDSFPINPDEPFHLNTFIRGSKDWAPPRQQIIFTVHPTPDRRRQMLLQNNRCAGCGMKVARAYVHTFRYCEYLGKYFCSACHKNQISTIPARVLDKWDFSLYAVSSFSYKWLEQIWNLPLFHVGDLNPQLYDKAKPLMKAKQARLQLKALQEFISQCRFAGKEKEYCKEIPTHWTDTDVDIWSMTDFVDVKNSVYTERIQEIIKQLEQHILKDNCELCMARGFLCELCPNKRDIIFPWQAKIKRCTICGSCFHDKCFIAECSKCERLKQRKRQLPNFS